MSRWNDDGFDPNNWTNARVIAEVREYANFENLEVHRSAESVKDMPVGEVVRDLTRNHRVHLNGMIGMLERRYVRRPGARAETMTNLMAHANFSAFEVNGQAAFKLDVDLAEQIRFVTADYRATWVNPLINKIEADLIRRANA